MTLQGLFFVILQLILLLVFAVIPGGHAAPFGIQATAFILVTGGALIISLGLLRLGPAFTPLPHPRKAGNLITTGIYKWIRHPLYTGLILITGGIALYSYNIPRSCITLVLLLVLYFKSVYEERLLLEKFPEYSSYKLKTGRFFPKIFK